MNLKPQIVVDIEDFLIDINESPTLSNVLDFRDWKTSLTALIIYGPGTATGTLTLQESFSDDDVDEYGTTWRDVQSAGADVTIPADGVVRVTLAGFARLRIKSGSSEVANRRFVVKGLEST